MRAQGVGVAVDYAYAGWWKGLSEFDLVLDAIGGSMLRHSHRLLRAGGRVVTYGVTALGSGTRRNPARVVKELASMPVFHPAAPASASKGVIGLNMLRIWDSRGTLEPFIEAAEELFADGPIDPVVAASFPFERAAAAHEMLLTRATVGKAVLTPD